MPDWLPDDSKGIHPFPYQAAENAGLVIPNLRRLRVRDLLFDCYGFSISRNKSAVTSANAARSTDFFG